MEALRAAFQAAGAISASDCVKLAPFSHDDPAIQVEAFRAAHPRLFYDKPSFDARTATPEQVGSKLAELQRQESKRQSDAATARTMERLTADRAKADAFAEQQAVAVRQKQEQQELADRHRRERAGWRNTCGLAMPHRTIR